MPCMQCANGKYKYGQHGRCNYDSLQECEEDHPEEAPRRTVTTAKGEWLVDALDRARGICKDCD